MQPTALIQLADLAIPFLTLCLLVSLAVLGLLLSIRDISED